MRACESAQTPFELLLTRFVESTFLYTTVSLHCTSHLCIQIQCFLRPPQTWGSWRAKRFTFAQREALGCRYTQAF